MLLAAVEPRRQPYTTGWHRLPGTLLEWAEGGSWLVELKDRRPMVAAPGRILVIPSGRLHRLTVAPPGPPMTTRFVILGLEFPNGMDLLHYADVTPVLSAAASRRLRPLINRLIRAVVDWQRTDVKAVLKASRLALQLADTLIEQSGVVRLPASPEDLARLEPALEHIAANLDKPLNRRILARRVGLSATRFHYVFKSALGMAPMEYVQLRRTQLAQRLLASTRLTVREIAFQCGYSSPQYFARVFRRETGRSPGAYRRQDNP